VHLEDEFEGNDKCMGNPRLRMNPDSAEDLQATTDIESGRFYRRVFALAFFGILGIALFLILNPFLKPIVWALLLGFLLFPLNRKLRRVFGGRKGRAAIAITTGCLLCVATPTTLLVIRFVTEAIDLGHRIAAGGGLLQVPLIVRFQNWVEASFPAAQMRIHESLTSRLTEVVNRLVAAVPNVLSGLASLVLTFVVLFFVLRNGDEATEKLLTLIPMTKERKHGLVAHMAGVTRATVLSSFVTAVAQGTLVAVGFLVTGLPSPLVFGVLAAFASLIPVGGTALVWGPGAIVLATHARWGAAIALAAWGILVVGLVDNIIRPKIVAGRGRTSTVAVLLGALGGISAFGLIGTFLGPVLIAFAVELLNFVPEYAESGGGDA
jgi:predicted PurR-regulated permease PerM